nr:MAG TPA: hypothetical protein [Caudoviricetes sp.]
MLINQYFYHFFSSDKNKEKQMKINTQHLCIGSNMKHTKLTKVKKLRKPI